MNNSIKKWAKVLNKLLTKDLQMANKHIKNASHHVSSGNQNNNEMPLHASQKAMIQNTDITKYW